MIESHYRSLNVALSPKRDSGLLACFSAMGLTGKNIANTTTFLLFLNAQVDRYNLEQAAKRNAKIAAQAVKLLTLTPEEAQKIRVIVPFAPVSRFDTAIAKTVHDQMFNGTFLYYAVQKWDAQQAEINKVAVPDTQPFLVPLH